MTRITTDTYHRAPRPTSAVRRLSERLHVEPRTVRQLARRLDLDLQWLDIVTGPDVVRGTPASWEACIALGIDPITGEPAGGEP